MGYQPILVVCQPDNKKNRKKEVIFSPVKQLALKHNLNLVQPKQISEIFPLIQQLQPDLLLTAAYGQFVPEKILQLFPLGGWNVHGSLLPKLRGGAPINWAIINGEKITGVSLMAMVKQMDAGGIVGVVKTTISKTETYGSLLQKMLICSQKLIQNHFPKLLNRNYFLIPQNEQEVTFAYHITKADQLINWLKADDEIERKIRGLNPLPAAKASYQEIILKIYQSQLTNFSHTQKPGTIIKIDSTGLWVVCGNNKILKIQQIQLPGKKVITIQALIHGHHPFKVNTQFDLC